MHTTGGLSIFITTSYTWTSFSVVSQKHRSLSPFYPSNLIQTITNYNSGGWPDVELTCRILTRHLASIWFFFVSFSSLFIYLLFSILPSFLKSSVVVLFPFNDIKFYLLSVLYSQYTYTFAFPESPLVSSFFFFFFVLGIITYIC